jgi:hypothetical protein
MRALPLIQDILDQRAEASPTNETWPALWLLVAGGIAAGLPSLESMAKLASSWPGAYRAMMLMLPLGMATMSLYFVTAVETIPDATRVVLVGGERPERHRYMYSRQRRAVAKILLPVSLAGVVGAFIVFGPNMLLGRTDLVGYICHAESGSAFEDGSVSAVSSAEEPASEAPVRVDDTGYFILPLSPWAAKPARLVLRLPTCDHGTTASVVEGHATATACPAEGRVTPARRAGAKYWLAACQR